MWKLIPVVFLQSVLLVACQVLQKKAQIRAGDRKSTSNKNKNNPR